MRTCWYMRGNRELGFSRLDEAAEARRTALCALDPTFYKDRARTLLEVARMLREADMEVLP